VFSRRLLVLRNLTHRRDFERLDDDAPFARTRRNLAVLVVELFLQPGVGVLRCFDVRVERLVLDSSRANRADDDVEHGEFLVMVLATIFVGASLFSVPLCPFRETSLRPPLSRRSPVVPRRPTGAGPGSAAP